MSTGPRRRQGPSVPVLMPVALDQTYDYLLPPTSRPRRQLCPGPLRTAEPHRRGLGRARRRPRQAGARQEAEDHHRLLFPRCRRCPPYRCALPNGWRATRSAARHGGAHDDGLVRRVRAGEAPLRRPAQRGAPRPPRMTPARTRALEIAADGLVRAKSALAAEAQCSTGVVDGLIEAGVLVEVAIPESRFGTPNPAHATVDFADAPGTRRARHARCRRRRLLRDAARRRHRLRQDRGLFRGGRAHAGVGAAGAHHAARDRAHQPVHGPLHGALRLRAGRMAFGALLARARARLARGRQRRGPRRGRRALGAVPALPGPRPDRGRRGARRRLQAGRPRALPGARHGRGARQSRQVPGDPLVGHALDREPRQRAHRPLPQRRAARALLAAPSCPMSSPSTCAATRPSAASGWPRRSSPP